ncbi:MAG: tRNA uridine-5-carboxymethylaminomethyl(34) synthesis enzyme MnmG [Candidatus Cloacimonetes bacterium]|nr:tRNA uridine-5-carboxymethylaminomethyl(34) synthesis enzyme MnmG [Candidatus Cloacimonadota bacterium]
MKRYDVIVIGAGHAGLEAALATSRMGLSTLCITLNLDNIALMPCNPSIGGTAKGHLVREIDALGGQMGLTIDKTLLQIRTLNSKKGPAVQALRAQADKILYQAMMKRTLEQEKNLSLLQAVVTDILVKNDRVYGIRTISSLEIHAQAVIVTTGTFLNGKCHIGHTQIAAGRIGEPPATHLSASITGYGIQKGRLKTGTPPRILDSSIDYKGLEIEAGEEPMPHFSYLTQKRSLEQIPCHITHTTENTRKVIEDHLHLSPLYSGQIEGLGPRYCPSIEDKFVKFPDKPSHLLYLEPESRFNHEVYLQGFSSSLPHSVQIKMVHTLPGLEKAKMLRPGYAVEYDFFNPIQLFMSLESKIIENLYFAGQVNGTSGYEEAAAQGIIAGINAANKIHQKPPIGVSRENSYIGVLINDLVTKGTKEPYRMFTSLVEHRTFIRHDNADMRLTKIAYEAGLANETRLKNLKAKRDGLDQIQSYLKDTQIPGENIPHSVKTSPYSGKKSLYDLLRRPELNLETLQIMEPKLRNFLACFCEEIRKEAEIEVKYSGYIQKQKDILKEREGLTELRIPTDMNYDLIVALSKESRQKLKEVLPQDVAQASLIAGVRQSDLALLINHLKRQQI